MKSRNLVSNIIIAIMAVFIVILGFQITNQQFEIEEFESQSSQVSELLNGKEKVAGYTCGVLNTDMAQQILGADSLSRDYGQGPTDQLQSDKSSEKLLWSDSCRYVSDTNSNVYVEFYVATFDSEESAEDSFMNFLPLVNNAELIKQNELGSELMYDEGVFYLLNNNKVIQVAANNSSGSNIKEFSFSALDKILSSYDFL